MPDQPINTRASRRAAISSVRGPGRFVRNVAVQLALETGTTIGPTIPDVPISLPCNYDLRVDMSPEPSEIDINEISWAAEGDNQPDLGITSIRFEGNWDASCMRISYMPSLQHLSAPYATDLGEPSILANPALLTVSAPLATKIWGSQIYIQGNPLLQSISFPSLVEVPTFFRGRIFEITDNPSLTTIDLGSFVPIEWTGQGGFGAAQNGIFTNNALSAETVNHILARFVANPQWGNVGMFDFFGPVINARLDLSGGTNAAPTGQGIIDKAALAARQYAQVITN